jgi:hypothetical protein
MQCNAGVRKTALLRFCIQVIIDQFVRSVSVARCPGQRACEFSIPYGDRSRVPLTSHAIKPLTKPATSIADPRTAAQGYTIALGFFRFRRSFKVVPGVRLNLSKTGVSTSVGRRGLWFTLGPRGTRSTVGLPETGVSYTEQSRRGVGVGTIVLLVVLVLIALAIFGASA